ncbi:MAG TPA: MarR family transcriptional regulator [Candidatus Udaeobacter sp.]|nr:MarR family transcriptional regulator [Candidatus Udaeobacter sp.]
MKISRENLITEIMENLHAIKNRMHVNFNRQGFDDCMTHSQLFVLSIIKQNPSIGIKELAKKMNISPSAITQLVDSLADSGYAIRQADPKDRRALLLGISEKGLKYLSLFKNKYTKVVAVLFNSLNDEELKNYLQLNKKILTNVLEKK